MITLLLGLALATPSDATVAECDRAVEALDAEALQRCVEAWVDADPKNPSTDWYAFHLGIANEDVTAVVAARNRALARGIDDRRARVMGTTELPYNPMLTVQRVFLAVVLLVALLMGVWARIRALRETRS